MIKVIVGGDFVPLNRVSDLIHRGQYSKICDLELTKRITEADYSIINLECPIVLSKDVDPIKKTGPNLKTNTTKVLEFVKSIGVNCLTLANNHFYDYGDVGVIDTIESCNSFCIDYVGGGKNISEASNILYKVVQNKKIAIINICENEWSIATEKSGGAAPLNIICNYRKIKEASLSADFVIVIVHGGTEFYNLPTPRMKETYRFFIDGGADIVINHHQHCYSGYEKYNDKYIFYGLGNFCFDKGEQDIMPWNKGYLLELLIGDDFNFNLLPYIQCARTPQINIISDEKEFFTDICKLNSIITNDSHLQSEYDKMVLSKHEYIKYSLDPYSQIKFINKLYRRGLLPSLCTKMWYKMLLGLFRCESHRDILLDVLRNINR